MSRKEGPPIREERRKGLLAEDAIQKKRASEAGYTQNEKVLVEFRSKIDVREEKR